MTHIDFKYGIKDEVTIKALKVRGMVVGLYYGETGNQYQVSYFLNGEKKTIYLYEEDLIKFSADTHMGFKTS